MKLNIPEYVIKKECINTNIVFQLGFKQQIVDVDLKECEDGFVISNVLEEDILITNTNKRFKKFNYILKYKEQVLNETSILKWYRFKKDISTEQIKESYECNYNLHKEIINESGEVIKFGLRTPQIGAVHSILSNITNPKFDNGIIVMPTGTGKTEVMLTSFLNEEIKKLIVLTPSKALRNQIGNKFKQLGILKELGIINEKCKYPVVGILKKNFTNKEDEKLFFEKCNVIITSMQLGISIDTKNINECFSHLFIDEAHHITANKWGEIADKFENQIIQFTATPFRNDGKMMKGNIIYKYSLLQAQEEKYFKNINFEYIREFDEVKADRSIASKAIEILNNDINTGYNHVIMARVESIKRAKEIIKIYEELAPDKMPLMISNDMSNSEKEENLNLLLNGSCKIIVCVNMLGEGFDFPKLKIAAIHDPHKSIATTIQFVGRFTRTSKENIGDASVVANIANDFTNKVIEELYSQDSDWNKIIRGTSDVLIDRELRKIEFLNNFEGEIPEIIPLQNIFPALSTYVFKTKYARFLIDDAIEKIKSDNIITSQNYDGNILTCIEKQVGKTDWCSNEEIRETSFDLYIIYYDSIKKNVYVGTTTKNPPYEIINKCFDDCVVVNGETTFKCLANIKRLKLSTLGLNSNSSGYVSYRMYAGRDVIEGISDPNKLNSYKNNLFGKGYENENECSIGCSKKGKIWSKKIGNLLEWKEWCDLIGEKISDESIKVEDIIKGIPVPKVLDKLPDKVPISIEFQPDILIDNESRYIIKDGEKKAELTEVDIRLLEGSNKEKIKFVIESLERNIRKEYEISINNKIVNYKECSGTLEIKIGNKYRNIKQWFLEYPPKITYMDGSTLENNYYLEFCSDSIAKYNKNDLIVKEWEGTNIRKESQGIERVNDSIQYKIINDIKIEGYDIIFDDDGSGEIADIVSIKVEEEIIYIDLYHCKYSHGDEPGARVSDLYEVCGQSQKSVNWKVKPDKIFKHMIKREQLRQSKYESTRFEIGDENKLNTIMSMAKIYPIKMNVYIVQPGISKKLVSNEQLNLLGVTQTWLLETLGVKLYVIVSE